MGGTEPHLLRYAIRAALHELGVPDGSYPAPVANAVEILNDALIFWPGGRDERKP